FMAALAPDDVRDAYLELTRRRRLYGGLLLVIFVAMMAAGFRLAESRNAGGFVDGLPMVLDFPSEVLAEAWQKRANLPGLLAEHRRRRDADRRAGGGGAGASVHARAGALAAADRAVPPADGRAARRAGNRGRAGADLYPGRRAGPGGHRHCPAYRRRAWQAVF